MIGAGNGKIIEFLINQKNKKVYIYEPIKNLEILQKKLLKHLHLKYIHNISDIKTIPQNNLFILVHPTYRRIFPFLINKISSFFENDINKKTYYKNIYTWISNYIKNLKNHSIKIIYKIPIKKEKILFCGSGYTLIEDLKSIVDLHTYFIIAADSAVIPLINNNINIDLIVSIDPNIGSLYHFYNHKNKLKHIPVLTWLGARSELHRYFENIYYILTGFSLDLILKQYDHKLLLIDTPTNDILGYALNIAQQNNKKIEFAGCGLKDSLKQYYYTNTGYDYYAITRSNRIFVLENYHFKLYQNQSYKRKNFKIPSIGIENNIKETLSNSYFFKDFTNYDIKNIFLFNEKEILTLYPYLKIFFDLLNFY